jgi:hypothetical protein
MRLTKLKLLATVLAVVGLIGIVAGGVTQRLLADWSAGQPGPADIVAAWKAAGAQVGWMRLTPAGRGDPCKFFPETEGKAGDLPAFRFARWPAGRIAELPAPASAFGLCLRSTKIQDAGLKELAGLTNLEALDLSNTAVTDLGLKALAGLKRLRTLALRGTPVTDAGLKELAGLESLQELDLTDSRVTGAAPGLRELAGLKQLRTLCISQIQLGSSLFGWSARVPGGGDLSATAHGTGGTAGQGFCACEYFEGTEGS